jgi:hypothetical protein
MQKKSRKQKAENNKMSNNGISGEEGGSKINGIHRRIIEAQAADASLSNEAAYIVSKSLGDAVRSVTDILVKQSIFEKKDYSECAVKINWNTHDFIEQSIPTERKNK